jgi:hypothetical protein
MINVPSQAYKVMAQGHISKQEMAGLEKFADALNKVSALPLRSALSFPTVPSAVGTTLMVAGALSAAELLSHAAANGMRAAQDKLTYRRDLNRVLDVSPEIKTDYPERDIHLAYQSMRTLNPTFAKDPLVGATLLQQILRNRDISDPSKPPRMDLGVARELISAQEKGQDQLARGLSGAFSAGITTAIKSETDLANITAKHQMDLEGKAREHERSKTLKLWERRLKEVPERGNIPLPGSWEAHVERKEFGLP